MTTILIVEDEGLIAIDLQKRLERLGYSVPMIADNAADAIAFAGSLRPSLVLMDIHLIGPRDGVQAADEIRQRFQLPVIFVTAHADSKTLERARITEPFGYIVKPFHGIDFRAQIEMAIWKHKMEQKLRISEAWLATTLRNVADALIATDSEGNITFLNPPAARLTDWTWTEAKGVPFQNVFQAFDEKTNLPVLLPVNAFPEDCEVESETRTVRLHQRGGAESTPVEVVFSPNRDESGLMGIITVFRDITERSKLEEQNRQMQKANAISLMAVGLGRELTESMRQMEGYLAEAMTAATGRVAGLLQNAYDNAWHPQALAHQLMAMGREKTTHSDAVDLNALLIAREERMRKALGKGRTLNLKLQPGIPLLNADADQIGETVLGLLDAARRSLPRGGAVDIATAATMPSDNGNCTVQLTVHDNGKVALNTSKDRVFDPYFASRPGAESAGLALANARRFAVLSGGSLDVKDVPGEGRTFLMKFPALHSASQSSDALTATRA